ncbi:MAG: DUF6600 domain-containing protein [Pyrinomonadaceae bacterium]
MRSTTKIFLASILTLLAGAPLWAAGSPAQRINLPTEPASYAIDDDEEPEVTARVARISFLSGEAKIRRAGIEDWETATLNLPLVEGDEIATDAGARVEIQFDKNSHVRLSENAFLKVVTLRDEAIALSLSLGSMNVTLRSFDKESSSFEIDAPKTTVAVQKSGTYRIDAGREGDSEIRVVATDGGEARVFSDTSAFTLKNGRSSLISIGGPRAGEWDMADASRYEDEFDQWTSDRDATIAKQLKDAYYDTYYDNDLYGADDLSGNGDWVFVNTYGYVWRPYRTAINRYDNWSPYRYGHWRWMPPYGWIWVNDEPWGWATYHHGRWFSHAGQWYWSPYGFYRPRRSWWFPALVVINIFNNNTCWYPLSYRHRYRNYNAHNIRNNGPRDPRDLGVRKEMPGEFEADIPPGGVVSINTNQFGMGAKPNRQTPPDIAKAVLSRKYSDRNSDLLPDVKDIGRKINPDIAAEKPKPSEIRNGAKIGAGIRRSDVPIEKELREKTIFDGRKPKDEPVTRDTKPTEPRKTGVFQRPPAVVKEPSYRPPTVKEPTRTERPKPPVKEPVRTERPVEREKPRYDPPAVKPPVRVERPPTKSAPKPAEKKPEPPPAKDDTGKTKKDKP